MIKACIQVHNNYYLYCTKCKHCFTLILNTTFTYFCCSCGQDIKPTNKVVCPSCSSWSYTKTIINNFKKLIDEDGICDSHKIKKESK